MNPECECQECKDARDLARFRAEMESWDEGIVPSVPEAAKEKP